MNNKALREFNSPDKLDERLATAVCEHLEQAIKDRGRANLAVSGGRTPTALFHLLAEKTIDWSKVNVVLADERWVKTSSKDSNEKLVRETLLQSHAAQANFISLKQDEELSPEVLERTEAQIREAGAFPFDVLTLGLGEDGHTASLFPCSAEIYDVMAPHNEHLLRQVSPQTAPYDRVTFTLAALLQSKKVFLHVVGSSKLDVLKQAEAGENPMEMPIRALLQDSELDMEIYWAPR